MISAEAGPRYAWVNTSWVPQSVIQLQPQTRPLVVVVGILLLPHYVVNTVAPCTEPHYLVFTCRLITITISIRVIGNLYMLPLYTNLK